MFRKELEYRPWWIFCGLLIAVFSATGCSGGSGSGGDPIDKTGLTASFSGSGTGAAANRVRLTGAAASDLVTVRVMIGGTTTSSDLYGFAFDLLIGDPTVADFVDGSESFGSALTTSGGQGSQVLAVQQGDRVTVGVTKLGGGSGNGVGAGESDIVELVFRLLKPGTTSLAIAGAPSYNPAALDSLGGTVGSVTFDVAQATLVGL